MEVAVFNSSSKRLGRWLAVATVACLLAGCSDMLTYSQDFKRVGMRQYNRQQYEDAAGSFAAAAKQDPTDYQTQYYLGRCYEQTGQPQLAIAAYRLCLKLRTLMPAGRADIATRERVISRLAMLIAHLPYPDAQINDIEQQAKAQNSAQDYRLLARVFALRGDADSAVDCYRRAVSFSDNDFTLEKEYGLYLLKINQTAQAARVLKLAWQMDSSDQQVVRLLRGLGVTDSQLVVSSTRMNSQSFPTPRTAWDVEIAPRD
jgi:Tfp pilus assembly protein PilF